MEGGSPTKSSFNLRSNVTRLARGAGCHSRCFSPDTSRASTGLSILSASVIGGSGGRWTLAKEYVSRKYSILGETRGQLRLEDTIQPAHLYVGDEEITDFQILPGGGIEFVTPPLDPSLPTPTSLTLQIISGSDVITVPQGLVYFDVNYPNWAAPLATNGTAPPLGTFTFRRR